MLEQAKACTPTDHCVRTFKDGLGSNITIKTFVTFPDVLIFWYPYSSTSKERGLRGVVPAAVATTQTKPHAQQQLARDLEVERAAMGQRRLPQSFGEVQRGNPQPCRWLGFLLCTALLLYSCKKRRVSLRLDPYVSHRGGSIVVLPAANLRWPLDKCGLLTLARPSVSCRSTLRAWFLVCGSTLRVSSAAKAMMAARGGRANF